ncbi:MAG: TetR family transcriptional regulator [Caulobacteraceae bacterium]|nr:TetR family transcriptional regulator [Caulobacteraceae bacterium]
MILAAADLIAQNGLEAASARAVAAAAGTAPSAINYNFGALEQLLSQAFTRGAARTAAWIEAREIELLALPRTPASAALALEFALTAWTREARPLALLYQEGLAAMAGQEPVAGWTRLWRDLWLRLAEAFGLSPTDGRLMHFFFESEALYHLSVWSPALDQAALRETSGHFATLWLGAPSSPILGALTTAERAAGTRAVGSIAPAAARITEAAAQVIEAGGLGALTHRAVAARAGVTTGAVTHHFRTIEGLVAGAIRGQVALMSQTLDYDLGPDHRSVEQLETVATLKEALGRVAGDGAEMETASARRHLFLAALRRPDMASAGAVIRYAHGGTVRDALGRIFHIELPDLPLHAGVLSRLLAAHRLATSADTDRARLRQALVAETIERLFRRLEARVN